METPVKTGKGKFPSDGAPQVPVYSEGFAFPGETGVFTQGHLPELTPKGQVGEHGL